MRLTSTATFSLAAALLLAGAPPATAQRAARFTLTSPDVKPGSTIGQRYAGNVMGCTGQNESPALQWSGAPAGTKSFAVTVYDPDAPTGSGFWHWVVFNIPATATALPVAAGKSGALPTGAVQGNTDLATPGYLGPCPPPGETHRYVFSVYALKTDKIEVPANATAALVGFNLHANQLAKATFTAKYHR
jgi:Raf kinase inhibitor-like YbhB/YbcL family protein